MKIVSNFMSCSIVKMTLRQKKTCRNKLTLSSGTLMFGLKEDFLVIFVIFSTNEIFLQKIVLSYIAAH